jgi:hypothetical protein
LTQSGFTSGGFFKEVTSAKEDGLLHFALHRKGKEQRKIFLAKTAVRGSKNTNIARKGIPK